MWNMFRSIITGTMVTRELRGRKSPFGRKGKHVNYTLTDLAKRIAEAGSERCGQNESNFAELLFRRYGDRLTAADFASTGQEASA